MKKPLDELETMYDPKWLQDKVVAVQKGEPHPQDSPVGCSMNHLIIPPIAKLVSLYGVSCFVGGMLHVRMALRGVRCSIHAAMLDHICLNPSRFHSFHSSTKQFNPASCDMSTRNFHVPQHVLF